MVIWPFIKHDSRHFRATKSVQDISALVRIGKSQNRCRPKSAQKKYELTWLYSALIKKKKIVSEVSSFAFNGNSLHWEHDCIFVMLLCLSVNHCHKQVINAQSQ